MKLRDSLGEVEVGIGDLLDYKGAILSVICPEDLAYSVIHVRLKQGAVERDGKRFELLRDGPVSPAGFPLQPCFRFDAELVAGCVREHRLMTFDIPAPVEPPARIEKKGPRAPTRKKCEQEHSPTTGSLFE